MRRFHFSAVVFTFAALMLSAGGAAADPVRITSGTISVGGAQDFFSRGFLRSVGFDFIFGGARLNGGDPDFYNVLRPLEPQLSRAGYWTQPGGASTLVLIDHSLFTVDAVPSLVPTPFSLSGRLAFVDERTRLTVFDEIVFGSGTATWTYLTSPPNMISAVRYDFEDVAPTPEPSTLLLIGSGLAALAARRRKRSPPGESTNATGPQAPA